MSRYSRNRFLPILLIVIVVIIAIVAIVSLARAIFFSGNRASDQASQVDTSRQALLSTAVNRQVRMTIRGPIVADERFNSVRISVSPTARSLVTYQGYLETSIDAINLDNNTAAYDEFVHALDKANLPVGTAFTGDKDDTRGICASKRLYEYEIMEGSRVVKRLWTSTCSGSPGSLKASAEQLTTLFVNQIPDGNKLIDKIKL